MQMRWAELSGNENKLFVNALEHFQEKYGKGPFDVVDVFQMDASLVEAGGNKKKVKFYIVIRTTETGKGGESYPVKPAILAEFFKDVPTPYEFQNQLLAEAGKEMLENKALF